MQSQPVEENRSDEEDDEDDVRVNLLSAYLEVKLVYRHGRKCVNSSDLQA